MKQKFFLSTPSYTILSLYLWLLLALLPTVIWAEAAKDAGQLSSLLGKGLAELADIDVTLTTGTPKPLHRAPSVATVITASEITAMGAITLDDVLETVPGLHVMLSPLNVYTSNYAIRGISSKVDPQMLLLVNGYPLRVDGYGSRPKTIRLSVSMISRIEIIRGPGSAVIGADAFAGVVNVITKDADEIDGTMAGMRAGSFATQHYWAQHGGVYDGWELALGAEYQKASGDRGRVMSSLEELWSGDRDTVWAARGHLRYTLCLYAG